MEDMNKVRDLRIDPSFVETEGYTEVYGNPP